MRQEYDRFTASQAQVIAIGPDSPAKMRRYWEKEDLPFPGIPDPDKHLLGELGQEFKLLRFGRMPAVIIISADGFIQYTHYGSHAGDIPDNAELLGFLDQLPPPAKAD